MRKSITVHPVFASATRCNTKIGTIFMSGPADRAIQAVDGRVSLHKVVVQVPGLATVVDAEHLKAVTQS
jgi:DNA-binding transcriptional regulator YhcF (GntR family)